MRLPEAIMAGVLVLSQDIPIMHQLLDERYIIKSDEDLRDWCKKLSATFSIIYLIRSLYFFTNTSLVIIATDIVTNEIILANKITKTIAGDIGVVLM
jgi:hypothetical protein